MAITNEKVITLYPQTPKIEKGNRTSLLNDHKLEIDVKENPHKILPFNQSNKEKNKNKNNAKEDTLKFFIYLNKSKRIEQQILIKKH